jgi:Fe-S-cluster-containing hydrogenase component 2
MLRVRSDLCRGCGLCIESCPQQAISIVSTTAYINRERCNQCYRCVEVCPQGAIMQIVPVSRRELQATVAGLKNRVEDIITRIEGLK